MPEYLYLEHVLPFCNPHYGLTYFRDIIDPWCVMIDDDIDLW